MATAKKAETAQELREKYRKKRLNDTTAAQYPIYNYIYMAYLENEGKDTKEADGILGDTSRLFKYLFTEEKMDTAVALYHVYSELCCWLSMAFQAAVLQRNSCYDLLMILSDSAIAITAGEKLRIALGDKAHEQNIAELIDTFTVDVLEDGDEKPEPLPIRNRIYRSIYYVTAYNTFVSILAKQTKIPELTVFQVDMSPIEKGVESVNDDLAGLRNAIVECRRDGTIDDEYLSFLMEQFASIDIKAHPVPESKIRTAEKIVTDIFSKRLMYRWTNTLSYLNADYWRI